MFPVKIFISLHASWPPKAKHGCKEWFIPLHIYKRENSTAFLYGRHFIEWDKMKIWKILVWFSFSGNEHDLSIVLSQIPRTNQKTFGTFFSCFGWMDRVWSEDKLLKMPERSDLFIFETWKISYIHIIYICNVFGGKLINQIQNHDRDVLFFIVNKLPLHSCGFNRERFQKT